MVDLLLLLLLVLLWLLLSLSLLHSHSLFRRQFTSWTAQLLHRFFKEPIEKVTPIRNELLPPDLDADVVLLEESWAVVERSVFFEVVLVIDVIEQAFVVLYVEGR